MSLYIGIDLGTSAMKLLLTDETGSILNTVTRDYPLHFPQPGWSEQDPADWWNACIMGIPELLSDFDQGKVAGIGVAGQMHGLVALDEQDEIIRPAILWNDGRTAEETEWLNTVIGKMSGVIPAALLAMGESLGSGEDAMIKALLACGLTGAFIANLATFGAEVAGCQAENGAASAMAASGVVSLLGGTAEQCFKAASLALPRLWAAGRDLVSPFSAGRCQLQACVC